MPVLFLVVIILMIMGGCEKKAAPSEDKSVEIKKKSHQTFYYENGDIYQCIDREYDDEGREILREEIGPDETTVYEWKYVQIGLTEQKEYYTNQQLTETEIHCFDERGNEISVEAFDGDWLTKAYNR